MHLIKIFPHRLILILITISCLIACKNNKPKPEPSFYYWRSVFRLSPTERSALATHHIRKLYLKLFDVALDPMTGKPHPVALLQCPDTTIKHYAIVPVVFITNETIAKIDSTNIPMLAHQITSLTRSWQKANTLPPPAGLQMDCDWTVTTRHKYFNLLKEIRKQLDSNGQTQTELSATIRLHQCKYRDRAGVPPVGKGLLMCYNMGNLPNPKTNNSILTPSDLEAYTTNLNTYPLPLDVAFPIFDWKVLFREGKFAGLIEGLPTENLQPATTLKTALTPKPSGDNRYRILHDTTIGGYDLFAGDIIRDERSNLQDILACADRIRHKLKTTPANIILFHLDSANLEKYTDHDIENIFHSCN